MSETTKYVRVGSVWRELDKRFERFVRVVALPDPGFSLVTIQTCGASGETFGVRKSRANIAAFGRRYALWMSAPARRR